MIYFAFVILAVAVVLLSIKLSQYVDLLDKNTNVSGAFIGGVLLAAVTSLPELFTSLSAVLFIGENNLVTGNILGSDLFNLAALGASVAVMFRGFHKAKVSRHHLITLVCTLAVYALIAVATFCDVPYLGFVNIISPFIFAIYILTLFITPKTEAAEEAPTEKVSVKALIIKFIIAAILLIGVSVCITYVTDAIADKLDLGKTFAGALLLGLTTSLPELVSTISLCRIGNFNASIGNILGSNIFNFFILFLADLLSFRPGNTVVYPHYAAGPAGFQSMLLLVLGAAASVLCAIMLFIKTRAPQKKMLGHVSALSMGSLMTAAYLLFLILSTVM